ncbi:RNA polymerase subunit sigma-70 [Escherichia coli]|uniref:RNA polymerase subunit sigma-70 n=1 Tax=Escherichia coli TaxID=562 RepID=UPI000BE586DA|nr:RNA polymerase subunit sigma-70 [Escherichia coli]
MNQAEFAKLHGVSRKTVTAWKARGWLVLDGEDIDVDASNERIRRYRKTVTRTKNKQKGNTKSNRVTRQGNSEGNSDVPCDGFPDVSKEERVEQFIASHGAMMTLDEARTMKENYFALLAKLEYDEKNGTLLPWKPIIERVGAEYTRVRTRLVALAPEHGPRLRALAGMTDDQGFTAALQELIYEALNELAFDRRETNGDTV